MTAIASEGTTSSPPPASGLVPTPSIIREAKRDRTIACATWVIPLAFLLVGMYWRLAVSSLALHLGLFGWILPLFIVTVVAALLFALVVEPASRGDLLGEEIRAGTAIDNTAMAADDELAAEEEQQRQVGDEHIEGAQAELTEARNMLDEALEVGLRGQQLAVAVLGVDAVPQVRSENLVRPTTPKADRITERLGQEYDIHIVLVNEIGKQYMPPLTGLPSPYVPYLDVPELAPNGAYHPETAPVTSTSTLGFSVPAGEAETTRSPRSWVKWALVLLVLVLLAAAAWFLHDHGAAASASAPVPTAVAPSGGTTRLPSNPVLPAGLKERRDYSFMEKRADDTPDRWSCARPIPVRLAGPAPAGGAAAMAGAVEAVRQASGLPLVVGTPVSRAVTDPTEVPSGTITFSFLTAAQITSAHLDMGSDVLGRGGPTVGQSGSFIAGWVAIRSDGSVKPTSLEGLNTARHELAHAVNLGHSLQHSGHREVMEPAFDPSATSVTWGPGDTYALAAVGCTTT